MSINPNGGAGNVTRVFLRPLGSPLPLGIIALVPAGVLLGLLQLGAIPVGGSHTVALLVLVAVFPLQFAAAIFSFLARDTDTGTGLGIYAGAWIATGVALLTSPPGARTHALGVFFLCIAAMLAVVVAAAVTNKAGPTLILAIGVARFALGGLYELMGGSGLKHADGVVSLVLAGAALYVALATALEDVHGKTILPLGRRPQAEAAVEGAFEYQVDGIEHEAGVRKQL